MTKFTMKLLGKNYKNVQNKKYECRLPNLGSVWPKHKNKRGAPTNAAN